MCDITLPLVYSKQTECVVNNDGTNYLQYNTNQDKHSTVRVSIEDQYPSTHRYSQSASITSLDLVFNIVKTQLRTQHKAENIVTNIP